jgi:alanine-glyoxylate transaminase / serine-glyoxylate transaminase / serine-pyruvate transaminase
LICPGSGTGAWEAPLVNTLCPGDRVLACETGQFSTLWTKVARNLGLTVDYLPGDWRHAADAGAIRSRLAEDRS